MTYSSFLAQILTELYNTTMGNNWVQSAGWLKYVTLSCEWYGITCDKDTGNITIINLQENGLQGSIPINISGLLSLEGLNLSLNQLMKNIPTEFGLLKDLKA